MNAGIAPTVQLDTAWHEDYGQVVWYAVIDGQIHGDVVYIGNPLCSDWPFSEDEVTVWHPIPKVPE